MRDDNDDEDHQSNSTDSITLTIGKTLHGKGRGTVLHKYLRYLYYTAVLISVRGTRANSEKKLMLWAV